VVFKSLLTAHFVLHNNSVYNCNLSKQMQSKKTGARYKIQIWPLFYER